MDCVRRAPALNNGTRDWLQCCLDTADSADGGCGASYPSQVQQWICQYLAFYDLPAAASRAGLEHRMFRLAGDSVGLVGQAWIPQQCRGTLYYVHGYLDHTGLSGHLIRFALDNHLAFITLDLPGHGLSQGKMASIASFELYADAVQALLSVTCVATKGPSYLVGQSTGAAVVANILLRQHERLPGAGGGQAAPLSGVALLAPLVRPHRWAWYGGLFKLLQYVIPATRRSFSQCSHDEKFLAFQRHRDPLQSRWIPWRWLQAMVEWIDKVRRHGEVPRPVLIVQGDADTTVDFRYNLAALERVLTQAKVIKVSGARHHLINESPPYRDAVFSALKNYFQW